MATPRRRPVLSVTMEPQLIARLDGLVARLPGSTRSGVVAELLEMGLPVFEQMAEAMEQAKQDDGSIDEQRAKDSIAQWAGAQLLGLYDTARKSEREEPDD